MKQLLTPLVIALLIVNISACGGGGSDSSTSNNTTTQPSITPAPQTPTGQVTSPSTSTNPNGSTSGSPIISITPTESSKVDPVNLVSSSIADTFYTLKPDINACRYGLVTEKVKQDVLGEVNYVRYLHGLDPVIYNPKNDQLMAQTALTMAAQNTLSHFIDSSWRCYTDSAKMGAQQANLSLISIPSPAYTDPKTSISLFIREVGSSSIGHRRWLLNPFMQETSVGMASGVNNMGLSVTGIALNIVNPTTIFQSKTNTQAGMISYPFGDYPRKYFQKGDRLSFSVFYDPTNYSKNIDVRYDKAVVTVKDSLGRILPIANISIDYNGSGIPNNYSFLLPDFVYGERYTVNVDNVLVQKELKNYQYQFKVD